jgi:hypothetical protein
MSVFSILERPRPLVSGLQFLQDVDADRTSPGKRRADCYANSIRHGDGTTSAMRWRRLEGARQRSANRRRRKAKDYGPNREARSRHREAAQMRRVRFLAGRCRFQLYRLPARRHRSAGVRRAVLGRSLASQSLGTSTPPCAATPLPRITAKAYRPAPELTEATFPEIARP